MKYSRLIVVLICCSIGNAHAYWGQSYVEATLAAMRNYWHKIFQADSSVITKKELGVAAGAAAGLGLAGYLAWKYRQPKAEEITKSEEARVNEAISSWLNFYLQQAQKMQGYTGVLPITYKGKTYILSTENPMLGLFILTIKSDGKEKNINDIQQIQSITIEKIKKLFS